MLQHIPDFKVRLTTDVADIESLQRLRYDVFVTEMGASGPTVEHSTGREADHFDLFATHLLLEDVAVDAPRRLVGMYRLMAKDNADAAGSYYSATEFDLSELLASSRRLLELGRSCLHADYRGGAGMLHLWAGLSKYVAETETEILFGTASFHGTDIGQLAQPLAFLHHHHAAPKGLTVHAQASGAVAMDLLPVDKVDRKAAVLSIPPLIKAYLRLGGLIGHGAFVDHAFNTTDVCMILDIATMESGMQQQFLKRAMA